MEAILSPLNMILYIGLILTHEKHKAESLKPHEKLIVYIFQNVYIISFLLMYDNLSTLQNSRLSSTVG